MGMLGVSKAKQVHIIGGVPVCVYEDEHIDDVIQILAEDAVKDPSALINPREDRDYKWCVKKPEPGYEVDTDANTQHILNPKGTSNTKTWNELILCWRPKKVADIKKRYQIAKTKNALLSSMHPLVAAAKASEHRNSSGEVVKDAYPTLSRNGKTFDYNDLEKELNKIDPDLLIKGGES